MTIEIVSLLILSGVKLFYALFGLAAAIIAARITLKTMDRYNANKHGRFTKWLNGEASPHDKALYYGARALGVYLAAGIVVGLALS